MIPGRGVEEEVGRPVAAKSDDASPVVARRVVRHGNRAVEPSPAEMNGGDEVFFDHCFPPVGRNTEYLGKRPAVGRIVGGPFTGEKYDVQSGRLAAAVLFMETWRFGHRSEVL